MDGQTSIPVPDLPEPTGPCDWCGDAWDVTTVEVQPASWGKAANGTRVLKRRATLARACRACANRMGIADAWSD